MDKTKRGFELAGAIIILVLGAFMILGSFMCLVSYDSFQAIFEEMYDFSSYDATLLAGMMQGIFAFLLLYSIALVIFSALLLPSPIKNGQYRKRLGIKITFLILVGLFVLLTLDGGILFSLLVLAAFVFVLLSACLKDKTNENLDETNETNVKFNGIESQRIEQLKELRDKGSISEEQYQEAINKIIEKM